MPWKKRSVPCLFPKWPLAPVCVCVCVCVTQTHTCHLTLSDNACLLAHREYTSFLPLPKSFAGPLPVPKRHLLSIVSNWNSARRRRRSSAQTAASVPPRAERHGCGRMQAVTPRSKRNTLQERAWRWVPGAYRALRAFQVQGLKFRV